MGHAKSNTLQHTATHCNTLQHDSIHICDTSHMWIHLIFGLHIIVELHLRSTRLLSSSIFLKDCNMLQHDATRCNTLMVYLALIVLAFFGGLQHAATRCNSLTVNLTFSSSSSFLGDCNTRQHAATRCNTLQHAATHCNTLMVKLTFIILKFFGGLQHAATSCNTLQHAATHCNTLTVNLTFIVLKFFALVFELLQLLGVLSTHTNTYNKCWTYTNAYKKCQHIQKMLTVLQKDSKAFACVTCSWSTVNTYQRVMSHMWMSHTTHVNTSRHTCKPGMFTNMSWHSSCHSYNL